MSLLVALLFGIKPVLSSGIGIAFRSFTPILLRPSYQKDKWFLLLIHLTAVLFVALLRAVAARSVEPK